MRFAFETTLFLRINKTKTFYKKIANIGAVSYSSQRSTNKIESEVIVMNRNDQQFMAQKIRTQYMEKETTELDELRALDAKVKRPANLFSYIFGSISAIIMGSGMSLVMTDIGATLGIAGAMVPGIIIGVIGLAMALVNYPMHQSILNSRKKKYTGQILKISEKIMSK